MKNAHQLFPQTGHFEYLSGMIAELRDMAINAGADDLGYVLEVAMLEAQLQLELCKKLQQSWSKGA